jgi:hypothetical protein
MKRIFFLVLTGLIFNTVLYAAVMLASPEAEFDRFMTDYVARLKAVKEERDDKKAVQLLNSMVTEFRPRAEKLKPMLEHWKSSLSAAEQAALEKRMEKKPYVAELLKIGFDMEFAKRIEANPAMKKAMNELKFMTDADKDAGASSISFSGGPLKGKSLKVDPALDGVGDAEQLDDNLLVNIYGKTMQNEEVSISFSIEGNKPGKYNWSDDSFMITIMDDAGSYGYYGTRGIITVVSTAGGYVSGTYAGTVIPEDGSSEVPIQINGAFKVKVMEH